MSILRANIFSKELSRTINISVILPIENEIPVNGFKTLYLLNGYMGDDLDWIHGTRIKRLAEANNIAVIMPAGENGFYVDDPKGRRNYSKFIGEELVEITRKMFHLSSKREDTMIAGLSMGGYGAMNNGLKYNETFGVIGAFSMALVNELALTEDSVSKPEFIEHIFGTKLEKIINTENDPRYLLKHLVGPIPSIYMACGTEDFVFETNNIMAKSLNEYRINYTYITEPGNHDWDFWDRHIEQFFKWLDVENYDVVSSGNVK